MDNQAVNQPQPIPTPGDWVRFEPAGEEDAAELTAVQARAFDEDRRRYSGQAAGGPPGYDSPEWNAKMLRQGNFYKVVSGSRIIGGLIVFRLGPARFELGRIWIDPEYQNRGIGTLAVQFIEYTFPARRWTLDTPDWSIHSQRFCEKLGYRKIGEAGSEEGRRFLYEKRL